MVRGRLQLVNVNTSAAGANKAANTSALKDANTDPSATTKALMLLREGGVWSLESYLEDIWPGHGVVIVKVRC